jgi:hypothetical protein
MRAIVLTQGYTVGHIFVDITTAVMAVGTDIGISPVIDYCIFESHRGSCPHPEVTVGMRFMTGETGKGTKMIAVSWYVGKIGNKTLIGVTSLTALIIRGV